VRKLEAGQALLAQGTQLSTWRYWRPDYSSKSGCDEG
jgi:hypothetical protein